MIELKRLRLINWHNFENVTFDCARLTYMIGVNAVGKTTILDAIRYCLTTNRNFNALGNKKSGRTLQGSVHAKQRGENAYRRPGRTVAYIGAEFWDTAKRVPFVIAVRVESEGPMQELHPGDQTWYISEDGCTLEQLPFIDPRTGAPSAKEDFKPATGRLSYTRSPSEARDRICRALGIGRASSPLGKKFNEVFQMGTSMDEIPNFREFLYQYILPQPELDLDALQGDRVELENLHAVLAEAQTRAAALETIVNDGREAAEKETAALVNRGAALLARAAADAGEDATWQGHLEAGNRQLETLNAQYEAAKNAEAEARRAYLAAHSAASASGEGAALDAMTEELARKKERAGRCRPPCCRGRSRGKQSHSPAAEPWPQRICNWKRSLAGSPPRGDAPRPDRRPFRCGKTAGRAVFRGPAGGCRPAPGAGRQTGGTGRGLGRQVGLPPRRRCHPCAGRRQRRTAEPGHDAGRQNFL